jgi:hypothetical protein
MALLASPSPVLEGSSLSIISAPAEMNGRCGLLGHPAHLSALLPDLAAPLQGFFWPAGISRDPTQLNLS